MQVSQQGSQLYVDQGDGLTYRGQCTGGNQISMIAYQQEATVGSQSGSVTDPGPQVYIEWTTPYDQGSEVWTRQ